MSRWCPIYGCNPPKHVGFRPSDGWSNGFLDGSFGAVVELIYAGAGPFIPLYQTGFISGHKGLANWAVPEFPVPLAAEKGNNYEASTLVLFRSIKRGRPENRSICGANSGQFQDLFN